MELPVSYWLSVCMRDFLCHRKGRPIAGRGSPANVVPIYFLPEYFVSVSSSWRSSGWEAASPEGAGADARVEGCLTKSRCSVASASQRARIIRHTEAPATCVNAGIERDPRSFGLLWGGRSTTPLLESNLFAIYSFPCQAKL